jgi:hypothetical protein
MVVPGENRSAGPGWPWRLGLRLAGAGLLAAAGGIHLDLYLTGYRTIPAIGWLFLLQVITAFALALAMLVTASRLAAAAGAGFALATLGGYLLPIWAGLFGFREVRTTAGIVAGVVEVAAFAVLAVLAAVLAAPSRPGRHARAARGRPGCRRASRTRRRPLPGCAWSRWCCSAWPGPGPGAPRRPPARAGR